MKLNKAFFITVLFVLGNLIYLKAQPSLEWAIKHGGTYWDIGNSITVDNNGSVYTIGIFRDTVDFDPGPGTFNLTSTGPYVDIFVSKVDSSGNLDWAINYGNTSSLSFDFNSSIISDHNNNVYLTGSFVGIIDFDPGASAFNLNSASGNLFICKLSASGNFLWAKQFFGTPKSIEVDGNGNIYTTGYFTGNVDFDPGAGTYYLISSGATDAFISKLDSLGNFVWAKRFGYNSSTYPPDQTEGKAIDVDINGNVYTTGYFSDTVDFDPGPNIYNLISTNGTDIFISKLDSSGDFLWVKQLGNPAHHDYPGSITIDDNGNSYTVGSFEGTADFDPGPSIFNLTSFQNLDVFINKLDASGNFIWAKQFGSSSTVIANSISNDSLGNIYTTGYFRSTTDFASGAATWSLYAGLGNEEAFISKLDSAGNIIWAKQLGFAIPQNPANGDDRGHDIALDKKGNIYTTGYFSETADFDPDTSTYYLSSAGYKDVFVHKMSSCFNSSTSTISLTTCNNYISPSGNHNWTTSGYYFDIIPNFEGCDSTILFDLTIINSGTAVDSKSTCDSLIWIDGNTYFPPYYTATHTIPGGSLNGCDSTIRLHLNFGFAHYGTDTHNTCDSLLWIDGNTYYSSNYSTTHTIIGGASNNCDSIVQLLLTINSVDTSITDYSPTLAANASNSTYQWLNCDSNFTIISGENGQYYVANSNGSYAVAITEGACTDTSSCYTITNVGILEKNFSNEFLFYPNPTSQTLSINTSLEIINLKIIDLTGKTIKTIMHNFNKVDVSNLTNGIYFIKIIHKEGSITKKFIKK